MWTRRYIHSLIAFMILAGLRGPTDAPNQSGDDPTKLESRYWLVSKCLSLLASRIWNNLVSFMIKRSLRWAIAVTTFGRLGVPALCRALLLEQACWSRREKLLALIIKMIAIKRGRLSWSELGNPYLIRRLFDGNGMLGLDLALCGAPRDVLIDANGVVRYAMLVNWRKLGFDTWAGIRVIGGGKMIKQTLVATWLATFAISASVTAAPIEFHEFDTVDQGNNLKIWAIRFVAQNVRTIRLVIRRRGTCGRHQSVEDDKRWCGEIDYDCSLR